MKRSAMLSLLPLLVLGTACRTAAPRAAATTAVPDPLRPYVGELRLLRHDAEKAGIRIDARAPLARRCAVAVRVRAAAFEKGAARFSLETLGVPRVNGRGLDCRRLRPEVELTLPGLSASSAPADLKARIDGILQTPEAFLASEGVGFDLAPGDVPAEVACREVFATGGESRLARGVTTWPVPLLSVDPWYHDPSGRVRQQSEVELDAVVGGDGRIHRPHLRTALSDAYARCVLRPLPLWRFRPARRAEAPVAARLALRPVLRID